MKYTILAIALLLISSAFAFKARSRAQLQKNPCQELQEYDNLLLSSGVLCVDEINAILVPEPPAEAIAARLQTSVQNFDADAYYVSCMEREMGEGQFVDSGVIIAQLELACTASLVPTAE